MNDVLEGRITNQAFGTTATMKKYLSAATNCRLTNAEQLNSFKAILMLERYIRSHSVSHRLCCNLLVVKDDGIPLIENRSWISGTARTIAVVHMDRVRNNGDPEKTEERYILTLLEQVCRILYDGQDEQRVREIVLEVLAQDENWAASHRRGLDMFAANGSRIPQLSPKEQTERSAAAGENTQRVRPEGKRSRLMELYEHSVVRAGDTNEKISAAGLRDLDSGKENASDADLNRLYGKYRNLHLDPEGCDCQRLAMPPELRGQVFGMANCILEYREFAFAMHFLGKLAEYSKTHPFRYSGGINLFIVRDHRIPILQGDPSVPGTACGVATVHMDRVRALSSRNNSAEIFALVMLEELCHILYDVNDEHRVKEIVCDIANIGYQWITPHMWKPNMFDQNGNWIPIPPRESGANGMILGNNMK